MKVQIEIYPAYFNLCQDVDARCYHRVKTKHEQSVENPLRRATASNVCRFYVATPLTGFQRFAVGRIRRSIMRYNWEWTRSMNHE